MMEVVLLLVAYAFALDCILRETQVHEAPDLSRLRTRATSPSAPTWVEYVSDFRVTFTNVPSANPPTIGTPNTIATWPGS